MAPNEIAIILARLDTVILNQQSFELRQKEHGEAISGLKSTIEGDRRYCGDCKAGIQEDIGELFERQRKLENWKAAHEATGAGEEKAEVKAEEKKGRQWARIAAIFTALAGGFSAAAAWPQVKAFLHTLLEK